MCNELILDSPVLKVFYDPQTETSARKTNQQNTHRRNGSRDELPPCGVI